MIVSELNVPLTQLRPDQCGSAALTELKRGARSARGPVAAQPAAQRPSPSRGEVKYDLSA